MWKRPRLIVRSGFACSIPISCCSVWLLEKGKKGIGTYLSRVQLKLMFLVSLQFQISLHRLPICINTPYTSQFIMPAIIHESVLYDPHMKLQRQT